MSLEGWVPSPGESLAAEVELDALDRSFHGRPLTHDGLEAPGHRGKTGIDVIEPSELDFHVSTPSRVSPAALILQGADHACWFPVFRQRKTVDEALG